MNRRSILAISIVALLGGCVDGIINSENVSGLIEKSYQEAEISVRKNSEIVIPSIPELVTRTYNAKKARDPFSVPEKLQSVFVKSSDKIIDPDMKIKLPRDPTRPAGYDPHPYEQYHLSSVRMTGSLGLASGKLAALLDLGNKKIVTLKEGDYIGKNHGKVVKITEKYIELSEVYGVAGDKNADGSQPWKRVPTFINLSVHQN